MLTLAMRRWQPPMRRPPLMHMAMPKVTLMLPPRTITVRMA